MIHWALALFLIVLAFCLGAIWGSRQEREEMARRIGRMALYDPDTLTEAFGTAMRGVDEIRQKAAEAEARRRFDSENQTDE